MPQDSCMCHVVQLLCDVQDTLSITETVNGGSVLIHLCAASMPVLPTT